MNNSTKILSDVTVWNKYSRYLPDLMRRETFEEVCDRYENMMSLRYPDVTDILRVAMDSVRDRQILPSMRGMQFAGQAIEKNESRVYNCAYLLIDSYSSFSETMFLLLGGTGVGYSVQDRHINKLPKIKRPIDEMKYVVDDSIEGWADAVKVLTKAYLGYRKTRPRFDFSGIRSKGERVVTAGGKAPGTAPLKKCLELIEKVLLRFGDGESLTSLAVHDIQCHIADAVLSGGIRRAAMISLFSKSDMEMISAKSSAIKSEILEKRFPTYTDMNGLQENTDIMELTIRQGNYIYKGIEIHRDKKSGKFWDLEQYESNKTLGWWVCNPQRGRANNSITLLRSTVTQEEWNRLWKLIKESGSGEPGVYLTNNLEWGTNPCCEIALKPFQFCNLTELNASTITTQEELNSRARDAAVLGTLQAGITDFHYLRPIWKTTTQQDALIGVGMTGIASGTVSSLDLVQAAEVVKSTNEKVARLIGINKAARTTTVKPSGTTSCVLGCSSGIHPWYSKYYIRRMQLSSNEVLIPYLLKNNPKIIKEYRAIPGSYVLEFPQKAPATGITREDETAIQFLERVNSFNRDWVRAGYREGDNHNNVSCTVSIKENEWDEVGEWMWENREFYNNISVLNYDGGSYVQAPFEEITEQEYESMVLDIDTLNVKDIVEDDDMTDLNQQIACAGGSCEVS